MTWMPCDRCRFISFADIRAIYGAKAAPHFTMFCESLGFRAVEHVGPKLQAGMALPCADCAAR